MLLKNDNTTRSILFFVLLSVQFGAGAQVTSKVDDATEVINRYKKFLLTTDTSRRSFSSIPPINHDGRWSDIDYKDDNPSGWQVAIHMRRIRTLAISLSSVKLSPAQSRNIQQTISLALNDWFQHRYKSRNWWYNEIGIPQFMRDILVFMKDSLSNVERNQCLEILNQHKVRGTGANLVWSADLGLHYAAFTKDAALMRHCRDTILSVFRISTQEGVQPDYSFHQHGSRLQMYHYGGAFLVEDVRLAWELQTTSLAFPADKIQLLTEFVLKGWQWMSRGINTTPGTIDRATSRKNALHSADIRSLIPFMYEIAPDSMHAFQKMLQVQNGQDALVGYRYFPYSDFTSYQQKKFSFFQKTNSPRTLLTESINEENLKGNLLNSGDTYFVLDGSEYFNLMPFWDWQHLPGTTNFVSEGKSVILSTPFVGNVSDGWSGLSVMDYQLKRDNNLLKAKKFWASWKNITVAMIAGLESGGNPVETTMEQSRWHDNVLIASRNSPLTAGTHLYKNVKWIYHHRLVYIPLNNDSVNIELKNVNASWYEINHSESTAMISDKIFKVSLLHHANNSAYAVAYASTQQEAANIANHPTWKILSNTDSCQAIQFNDGTIMVAMYEEGVVKFSDKFSISTSRPCLILWKSNRIFVSDPQHQGGSLELIINNIRHNIVLPADGTTIEVSK